MPAPLAMPPTVKPSRTATTVLACVSVVMIAAAAGGPPSSRQARGRIDTGQQPVHRQPVADQPGRADRDVAGPDAEQLGQVLGCRVRVLETGRPGAGVGAAGVEDDGADPAVP